MFYTVNYLLGITPTTSTPILSSTLITNTPTPSASFVNGGDYLVIGITVAIAVMVVLIMTSLSTLIVYFIFCQKKKSDLMTGSKVGGFLAFVYALKQECI